MKPRVSIIIPAYNTSRYIKRAIESALAQTEQNIEVIVVDDASTDNTVEVVNSFTDPRIKLLVNEANKGPSYSRNRAFKEAKGEWVALLDSDDWYAPKRLETLLLVAERENADLIADDLYLIPEGEDSPISTIFPRQGVYLQKPKQIDPVDFVDLCLSVTKPLIKQNFLVQHNLEFNESLKYEEDLVLFLLCLLNGARFFIVPEPYYFYRDHRIGALTTEYQDFHEQAYKTNLYLLQQEFTTKNPKLVHSLSKRFQKMKQMRAFYQVRKSYKEGGILTALIKAMRNPIFIRPLWERLPGMLRYHLFYRFNINLSK